MPDGLTQRDAKGLLPERPIRVVLATTNEDRVRHTKNWLAGAGLPYSDFEILDGPSVELGENPGAIALGKSHFVLGELTRNGLLKPDDTLFLAFDAENIWNRSRRGKPTEPQINQYFGEWQQALAEQSPVGCTSGTAAIFVSEGTYTSAHVNIPMHLLPTNAQYIEDQFADPDSKIMRRAHGLGAKKGIEQGDVLALNASGRLIRPELAVRQLDGVSSHAIQSVVSQVLFGSR